MGLFDEYEDAIRIKVIKEAVNEFDEIFKSSKEYMKTKQTTVEVNYDAVQSIANRHPFTPTNFVLAKLLPVIKVKQQRNEPDPDNKANEGLVPGQEGYVWKTTEVEVDSMYQKGVVIKLDSAMITHEAEGVQPAYKVGDIIVFPARAHYSLDNQGLCDGYTLVRPFDILGTWDNDKCRDNA